MLRTAKLLHPASDPAFRPTPGASLPGTLASPRTGLAPAGRRELLARLRHGCSFALMAPRAAGRTGFSWNTHGTFGQSSGHLSDGSMEVPWKSQARPHGSESVGPEESSGPGCHNPRLPDSV